jgi:hypothetical protein
LEPVYCDQDTFKDLIFEKLARQSRGYLTPHYEVAEMRLNPWNPESDLFNPVRNVFLDVNGVVLANMDAIFKFTGHYGGLLKQRMEKTFEKMGTGQPQPYVEPVGLFKEDEAFIFCDVGGGPGGFTDYIQFRVRENRIYGMTLKSPETDWKVRRLSTRYLNITYGQDGTGNLFTNGESYVDYVRSRQTTGAHLVAAHSDPLQV